MIGKILEESIGQIKGGAKQNECPHPKGSAEETLWQIAFLDHELNASFEGHLQTENDKAFPESSTEAEANFIKKHSLNATSDMTM